MKIEEGKFYWTRGGVKVGPIHLFDSGPHYDVKSPSKHADALWEADGTALGSDKGKNDIVGEWHDVTVVAGKSYLTADGETIGPMELRDGGHYLAKGDQAERLWDARGRRWNLGNPQNWIVSEVPQTTFNVGDRVRVSTGRFGPNQHGLIGTVTSVDDRDEMPVWVTYDPSEKSARSLHRENNCYDHSDLEPYGGPAKVEVVLKPGDRVVCTDFENSRDRLKGKLGTVLYAARYEKVSA